MKYMLLIYADENGWNALSEAERGEVFQQYGAYTQSIQESGHMLAGEALQRTSAATTVRVRGDETVVTDGPFAETKEQLGGYYLVDAANADEAIELAARIPGARHGSIEVRPVMTFEQEAGS